MKASIYRAMLVTVMVFGVATAAHAEGGPGGQPVFVNITLDVGDSGPIELSVPLVAGQAIGEHVPVSSDFTVAWDLTADPDPFISGNWTVQNNLTVPQTFRVGASIPVSPIMPAPNVMGGSVSGSVTDANGGGATFSTDAPTSVYTALINGSPAATLLDDPYSVSAGSFQSATIGPASFGDPIPSAPAPNVTITDIGIDLEFVLSPGDTAGITSVFVVEVPEPATLSMLAFGSLVLLRRRR